VVLGVAEPPATAAGTGGAAATDATGGVSAAPTAAGDAVRWRGAEGIAAGLSVARKESLRRCPWRERVRRYDERGDL
jgi:hypothetical protein